MFDYSLETSEIWIYDEIGPADWGFIDGGSVRAALQEIGGPVTIRVNSPGGGVHEGIAIYNAILEHPHNVEIRVDSLAASMASYILQAGNTRTVAENAAVFLHEPWTVAIGSASELRKEADDLEVQARRLVPDYAKASGRNEDDIKRILSEDTWLIGQEILDFGFADKLVSGKQEAPIMGGLARMCTNLPEHLQRYRPKPVGTRCNCPRREAARQKIASLKYIDSL